MASLLREWDEGDIIAVVVMPDFMDAFHQQRSLLLVASSAKRRRLLETFCRECQKIEYGSLLEAQFGPDIALLIPRVLSSMHKSTVLPLVPGKESSSNRFFALSEQLSCLQVFFSAPNWHVYFHEFQHADGISVLLRVLLAVGRPDAVGAVKGAVMDRIALLYILLLISRRGRESKEQISKLGGELIVVQGPLAWAITQSRHSPDASKLESQCREILIEQFVGNPSNIETIHGAICCMLHGSTSELRLFGAQLLRDLISPSSFNFESMYRTKMEDELVPIAIQLLRSDEIALQHEAVEILRVLLLSPSLQSIIWESLTVALNDAARAHDRLDDRMAAIAHTKEYEVYTHLRSLFVRTAHAVGALVGSNKQPIAELVENYKVLAPLAFALVVERPRSLKWHAAAVATHRIFVSDQELAVRHLAQLFSSTAERIMNDYTLLRDKTDSSTFADLLLRDGEHQRFLRLQFYRNGWFKPLQPPSSATEGCDRELREIIFHLESAARDYVDELQLQSYSSAATSTEDDSEQLTEGDEDPVEASEDAERRLRAKLHRHFQQFRSIDAASAESVASEG